MKGDWEGEVLREGIRRGATAGVPADNISLKLAAPHTSCMSYQSKQALRGGRIIKYSPPNTADCDI